METSKKLNCLFLAALFLLMFSSCTHKSIKQEETGNFSTLKDMSADRNPTPNFANRDRVSIDPSNNQQTLEKMDNIMRDRMIIRTGTMNLEIEKYEESQNIISNEANKVNGYISNTSTTVNVSGKKQGTIQVKVPAENFEGFVTIISKLGKVMSYNVSGNDVTEEFIDIEARHKTQKLLEERLLNLLQEKTAKLTDVVEVEQKLTEVRTTIETMDGRMRFLKNQSSYSTLTITLYEPSLLQTSTGGGFFYEIKEAFKKGLDGFTDVLTYLITFIIAFSPILLFIFILFVVLKKYAILRKRKRAQIQAPAV